MLKTLKFDAAAEPGFQNLACSARNVWTLCLMAPDNQLVMAYASGPHDAIVRYSLDGEETFSASPSALYPVGTDLEPKMHLPSVPTTLVAVMPGTLWKIKHEKTRFALVGKTAAIVFDENFVMHGASINLETLYPELYLGKFSPREIQ
jgi:hypothetical protein